MDFILDINMMRVMLPVCPDSAQKHQSPDTFKTIHKDIYFLPVVACTRLCLQYVFIIRHV